ncbi:hypothetical protein N7537_004395 [Penicillium hordei]|uniref:Rhodopsin domain-containing protein n=1 Tax=Penicillium hordei TaxID=40994 RepID=A0AAD6EBH6_9EURO|nr:uncharacterized protein N7537_004395 [Penicillium hordei]KAJ5607776.1 hypothetical protein N7537_004395 [Penicillium hordei]
MIHLNHRSPVLIVWSLIFFFLAAVAVALRVASIRIRRRDLKSHDYLVFFSLMLLTGYVVDMLIGATTAGYGGHTATMAARNPGELVSALKIFWASEWMWATSTVCFRLAILLLYMEIFPGNQKFFWCATSVGCLVFLYWVSAILTIALLCRPVAYNWNRTISGSCGDVLKIQYASAGFNMGIDLGVVLLPLPIVWRLQMSSRKKIGVTASFAIGILTAGINLGRIIQTKLCPADDLIYCLRDSSIFIMAEMTAGILVACVPTFGPLLFRGRTVHSAQPRDLPTIGSAQLRRRPAKLDSLLSTLDRSHNDEERGHKEVEPMGAPTAHAGVRDENEAPGTGILVTRDLDVHSLNVLPRASETSTV